MKPSKQAQELVTTSIKDVAILGMGLIGGSIAKDLQDSMPDSRIFSIGKSDDGDLATTASVITGSLDYSEIGENISLIIIATPLDDIISVAAKLIDQLKDTRKSKPLLIMDVGSVKKEITDNFEKFTRENPGLEFVSTHPMAGTEFSGFRHAKKHLFKGKPWIVCPHQANTSKALNLTNAFIQVFNAIPSTVDADTHDKWSALTSHGVIALSNLLFDFVWQTDPKALEIAGSGFDSTTRLASGNPDMHASIVFMNSRYVQEYLKEFLKFLADRSLDDLNLTFFQNNQKHRDEWIRSLRNTKFN